MSDLENLLTAPWSRVALVNDETDLFGDATMAALSAKIADMLEAVTGAVRLAPPAGQFGWLADYGITSARATFHTDGSVTGDLGITPEELFSQASTAYAAPGARFYVDIATGSDSNNGTSAATPFKSIWKAIDAAHTAAPANGSRIEVKAGVYDYEHGIYSSSGTKLRDLTKDIALVAVGGTVVDSLTKAFTTPTVHATYTNCYSVTFTGAYMVLDLTSVDEYGIARPYVSAASAAACNDTPGSVFIGGSSFLVNPFPGVSSIDASTIRVVMKANRILGNINAYFGGPGWELWGGSGCLRAHPATAMNSRKMVVTDNVKALYSTAATTDSIPADGDGIGASANWAGLLACFNTTVVAPVKDCFNVHSGTTAPTRLLTVNCRGYGAGFRASANNSNNGYTLHEVAEGVDIAGDYRASKGGTIHNIGTSKALMLGTVSADDAGDIALGGSITPTQYLADQGTPEIWLDRCYALGSSGAAYVGTGGGKIHLRRPKPTTLSTSGAVDTY